MMNFIKQIFHLLHPIDKTYAFKYSRGLRDEAEEKVEEMKADLNGCDEEWFLTPVSPLDECVPGDEIFK